MTFIVQCAVVGIYCYSLIVTNPHLHKHCGKIRWNEAWNKVRATKKTIPVLMPGCNHCRPKTSTKTLMALYLPISMQWIIYSIARVWHSLFSFPPLTKLSGSIPDWLASIGLYFSACKHDISVSCKAVENFLSAQIPQIMFLQEVTSKSHSRLSEVKEMFWLVATSWLQVSIGLFCFFY